MFMQSRRDPSVLRSLALSFGEGLAFSVGMKLTQNAIRPAGAEPPDFGPIAARLEQIEQRIQKAERGREPQQFDHNVIQAVVSAIETRLQEHSGQVERRLGELESAIAAGVQSTVLKRVEEQAAEFRAQAIDMHREFAGNVARIVAEQVAIRAAEMEPAVHERVIAVVAPLRAELADLRARMAETEATMAEFVSAISQLCRNAAGRNEQAGPDGPPPPPVADEPAAPAPISAAAGAEIDLPVPSFAQAQTPAGTWRIPVASSFLFAFTAVGLLLRAL